MLKHRKSVNDASEDPKDRELIQQDDIY